MNYEKQYEANQETAQELAEQQMRDAINLSAECRSQHKKQAAAARQRIKARRKKREKADRHIIAAFLLLGIAAVGVLGYLIGIGEGLLVLFSVAIAVVILLAVAAAAKISSKRHKRGRYERV